MNQREVTWLRRLRDLSHLLASQQDVNLLLPMILDSAIELTEAERGFLVQVHSGPGDRTKIKVEVARGFAKESLSGAAGKVSRTVVERVLEQRRGVLTTSEEDRDIRNVSSVQARRVLSIVSVPMLLRGKAVGVLYLDHRFNPEAFTEQDLPILAAFADQAAVALETASFADAQRAGEVQLDATRRELENLRKRTPDPSDEVLVLPEHAPERFGHLIGGSKPMQSLYAEIERASRSSAPVLISGASGTGKELVAREIHTRGENHRSPLLSENCAAISDDLLESELFGHKRGAFTGATADHDGLFVAAGEGTLFLDEVGDMSPRMQSKLLRVLQENRVRPVGGDGPVPIHCRVVAATHRDLRSMADKGEFRLDLYYRLDVLRLQLPSLCHRSEDIPALLSHFLRRESPRKKLDVSPKAMELLRGYAWPGNVRELENEARRLASLGTSRLSNRHLSPEIREGRGLARAEGSYSGKTLAEVEREMVTHALEESGGNKARAARALGIPKTTLYHLLDRYQLR
ncbi:MAG: sigma-54-dependent Fis family transcriptional regulator [Planctomycetes bacterium]|nr:sigma-54-dependent Fis family transcriptional regulator [Planctomycetota bacterium]